MPNLLHRRRLLLSRVDGLVAIRAILGDSSIVGIYLSYLGVGTTGSLVDTWADARGSSGFGATRTGSGTNRPSVVASTFGAQTAIRFDGVTNYLRDFNALTGTASVIQVFKLRAVPTSAQYPRSYTTHADSTHASTLFHTGDPAYAPYTFRRDYAASGKAAGIADANDTLAHIFTHTYNGGTNTAAASYTARLDGVNKTVVQTGSAIGFTSTDLSTIGAEVSSGGSVSAPGNIDLGGQILVNRVVSAADLLAVERVLNTLFALGLSI